MNFFEELYGNAESGYLSIWTLPDKRTYWFPIDNTDEAIKTALRLSDAQKNVYFGVGITDKPKPAGRITAEEVTAIPGLWFDMDIASGDAHAETKLPADIGAAMQVFNAIPLEPSIIIDSGHGLHAYWPFKEIWSFETPEEWKQAAELLHGFQTALKQHAASLGYKFDSTHDLSRVLRVPGTKNYKSDPVDVKIIHESTERYNPSDFEPYTAEPQQATGDRTRKTKFERRDGDGSAELAISQCAFLARFRSSIGKIPEPEWFAACANLSRCKGGPELIHELIRPVLGVKYDPKKTEEKIRHSLEDNHPHSCEYITGTLGFTGCPTGGCQDIKAPCGWALKKLPRARAIARTVSVETQTVFNDEIIGSLALLQEQDPAEFEIFKARAKGKISVNTLKAALKKHTAKLKLASRAPAQGVKTIIPDAPVDMMIPADWICTRNGILYQDWSRDNVKTYRASHVPVLLTNRLQNIDSDIEKIEVTFLRGRKWESVLLARSEVFDAKKVIKLADKGLTVSSESARWLVKWFDELEGANLNSIPEGKAVSRMGWRGDEIFIPGAEGGYRLDLDDTAANSAVCGYRTTGSFDDWKQFALEVRQRPVARFILSASFAAPLLRILSQRIFFIHNWGNSQDGKTAALYVALSVWGDPDELRTSFDSTKTGIEKKLSLCNDLPMGLNERETMRDKTEATNKIYEIAEGKGRNRGNKSGGMQQTATWRTIVLSTGEGMLSGDSSTAGAVTRTLEIYGGPFADNKPFASDLYRLTADHHGHAGPEFIQRLIKYDRNTLKQTFNDMRAAVRKQFPEKLDSHIDSVSVVALADFLVSQWIFGAGEDGAAAEAAELAKQIIAGMVTKTEASDVTKAWDYIVDWAQANEGKFRINMPTSYGFKDSQYLCVNPTVFNDALKERGFSPQKVLRELANEDKIWTTFEAGKRVFKIKRSRPGDNGGQSRMICIKLSELEK